MPNLSTPVHPSKPSVLVESGDRILSMGSCFAERMSTRLQDLSWPLLPSPLGTTFHPLALARQLAYATGQAHSGTEEAFLERDGLYFHWDASTLFFANTPEQLQTRWQKALESMQEYLFVGKWLFLTLGTAYGYTHKKRGVMVANCHKQPSGEFSKALSTPESMYDAFYKVFQVIHTQNPSLRVVWSVSPVRHTREGLSENMRSKARLIELCHQLVADIPHSSYFPAYEIMMDELRDYRYYAEDLIHPSPLAEQIIFDRFVETYFSSSGQEYIKAVHAINRDLEHEIRYPEASSTPRFLTSLREKIAQFPHPLPRQMELWEAKWKQWQGRNP